jgi:probable phosphoglycerate mutase
MPRPDSVDHLVASLVAEVDPDFRYDLSRAVRTLRQADYPEGALDVIMRPTLRLLDRVLLASGNPVSSANLFDRIEVARRQHLLPDELASYLHLIRTLSNKSHHDAEGIALSTTDAEQAIRAVLRTLEWYYCEYTFGPGLTSMYMPSPPIVDDRPITQPTIVTPTPIPPSQLHTGHDTHALESVGASALVRFRQQLVAEMHNNLVLELFDRPYYEDVCIAPLLARREHSTATPERTDIAGILHARRAAIVGEPGSGKTTALRLLTLAILRHEPLEHLPIYLPLASFAHTRASDVTVSFAEFLDAEVALFGGRSLATLRCATSAEPILVLDGWDEVESTPVRDLIRRHLEDADCQFVITTRPESQHTLPFCDRYDIAPLSEARVKEFLRLRIKDPKTIDALTRWIRATPESRRLAENPLSLSIASIAFLEQGRVEHLSKAALYDRAFETIVRQQHRRRIHPGAGAPGDDQLDALERVLECLAYDTAVSGEGRFFSQRLLYDVCRRVVGQVPSELSTLLTGRLGIIRDRRGGRMEFFHLWYQEYLAARFLLRGGRELAREFANPRLSASLPFVIGLTAVESSAYDLLATVTITDLHAYCRAMAELRCADGPRTLLLRRAIAHAENCNERPPVRIELAPALALVGRLATTGLRTIALERDGSEYTRRAAIEALALLQADDKAFDDDLLKCLDSAPLGVLWHVLELIGRRRVSDARFALEELRAHSDPIVVGDATWALRQLSGKRTWELSREQTTALLACLTDGDRHVQGHALRTLGRLRIGEALPELQARLEKRDAPYRWIAVEAASAIGGEGSMKVIAAALGDADVRVIAEALHAIGEDSAINQEQLDIVKAYQDDVRWIPHLQASLGQLARAALRRLYERQTRRRLGKLLLARHAQTDWNYVGKLQGTVDLPLSDDGRAAARSMLTSLGTLGIDRIVASTAMRASQTAKIYAGGLQVPMELSPGLRELDHGAWEGRSFGELRANPHFRSWYEDPEGTDVPGARETVDMAQQRVIEALRGIALEHPGETLLIVTHKHIRAIALCWLFREPLNAFAQFVDDSLLPIAVPPDAVERLCAEWAGQLPELGMQ